MLREGMEAIRPVGAHTSSTRRHWRACASLSGRDLSEHDLANAAGQYDQLGGGYTWHRSLGNIFQPGSLAAAAPPRGYSFHRILDFRGSALPLFQRLARAGSLDGARTSMPYAAGGRASSPILIGPRFSRKIMRAASSYQPCPRHRAAAAPQLHMDSRHPDTSPITVRSRFTRCRYLVCPSWSSVPVSAPSQAS